PHEHGTRDGAVDDLLLDHAVLNGIDDQRAAALGRASSDHIEAGVDRGGDGLFFVVGIAMGGENLLYRAAVADHGTGEAPLAAEQVGEQPVVGAAGDVVDRVVCRHCGESVALGETGLKDRQIVFAQGALGDAGVGGLLAYFQAVDAEVLGGGDGFQVFGV